MGVPYAKATDFDERARHTISGELRTLAVAAEGDTKDERAVEALTEDFARYEELLGRAWENDGRAGGKGVVALSRARALAYDAMADVSRYLLDPSMRPACERSFLAKSQQL
ncbi:hypothetical protein [Streptomyces sp. NPDC059491]|uniref:hypothetical protein n=1 Tax=Streptomyces sp. NPDC059491 TaxID=3346850 RepID=UPI0036A3EDFB